MKAKKAMKKIAALGMGATLMGATLLGAAAADLNDYPGMFITDGQFDGLLVVGEESLSIDTIGMTNIAMGLQAESYTETAVDVDDRDDTAEISVEGGVKFQTPAQNLYKYKTLRDIKQEMDVQDMPGLLADGTFDDEDYTQRLELLEAEEDADRKRDMTNLFLSMQDDDYAPYAGYYLLFGHSQKAYSYTLEFSNEVDASDASDIEGETIDIQGETYTITGVSYDGDYLVELELLMGDAKQWLTFGDAIVETVNGQEYTVEMVDLSGKDNPDCLLEINGQSEWLSPGETVQVGGLSIGLHDAMYRQLQESGMCEVSIGAEKMVLANDDEIEIEDDTLDNTKVYLTSDIGGGNPDLASEWTGLTIQWAPEDTMALPFEGDVEDRQLVDPVFGNFMYVAAGIDETNEYIEFDLGSSSGEMTFVNSNNYEIELPFSEDEGNVYLGDGADPEDQIYFESEEGEKPKCEFEGDLEDVRECEGARWLLSLNGEARLIELDRIRYDGDNDEYETTLVDNVYGSERTNDVEITDGKGTEDFYMPGLGTLDMTVEHDDGNENGSISFSYENAVDDENDPITTYYGMELDKFGYDDNNFNVTWIEEDEPENSDHPTLGGDPASVPATITYDDDLELSSFGTGLLDTGTFDGPVQLDPDNDDDEVYSSVRGTVVVYDGDDSEEMVIRYPASDVHASVYLAPTDAELAEEEIDDETVTSKEINAIPTTVNKFDSEVAGVSENNVPQNMITIGGPCANMVTSALMGSPEDCAAGFEEGKALLKLVEDNQNIALIVAGGVGEDTRIASTVLHSYRDYQNELEGDMIELTTVSETDIGFQAIDSFAAEEEADEE